MRRLQRRRRQRLLKKLSACGSPAICRRQHRTSRSLNAKSLTPSTDYGQLNFFHFGQRCNRRPVSFLSVIMNISDDPLSRILVAAKDIKPGEMILSELPLIKYPQWNSLPTCLGCYKLIDRENHIFCEKCNFPMCSEACCKTSDHLLECRLFQQSDTCIDLMPDLNTGSPIALYDIITPLRMLALREQEDQASWRQLCNLMSHKEEWDKLPAWRQQHQHAIDYIMKHFKLPNVTEDLILELFGIAYINDFSALVGDIRVRLAFPNAAMFSHDCAPNVVRHIENINHGHQIKCYAAKNIKKGDRLSTTYVDLFLPGIIRRDILLKVRVCFSFALIYDTLMKSFSRVSTLNALVTNAMIPASSDRTEAPSNVSRSAKMDL